VAARRIPVAIGTRKLRVGETVVCAELEDEAVLLDVASGLYYGLDSTGTVIWRLLTDGLVVEEIVGRMLAEYDVEAERLRLDVSEFLDSLISKGLLLVVDG
jgi:hypothetical protein